METENRISWLTTKENTLECHTGHTHYLSQNIYHTSSHFTENITQTDSRHESPYSFFFLSSTKDGIQSIFESITRKLAFDVSS